MIPIVPRPAVARERPGALTLSRTTPWLLEHSARAEEPVLSAVLRQALGYPPSFVERAAAPAAGPSVRLRVAGERIGATPEAYRLRVAEDGVAVEGAGPAGLFYGCLTLGQLAGAGAAGAIPCVEIEDAPRFPWRGLMLDVGRWFYPVEVVKRFIDVLAFHKMNVFHWHLTEDQGWRLAVERYPRLAEVAAWRSETVVGFEHLPPHRYDGKRHGGCYSRGEIAEVVAWAAARHVTVVPEIEMPGHSVAALAAYPELSCSGGPFEVSRDWGVHKDVYCAGNDAVLRFIEGVLDEVVPLFPSPWFHIGGDECPKDRWRSCPKCQERIRAEGLTNGDGLQSWFVRKAERLLADRGKRLIGWDEILEGGLAPNAAVMSWRGMAGGIAAARAGHDVVMTPTSHCYLDYCQSRRLLREPLAQPAVITLRKAWSFEPVPAELTAAEARNIRGLQGNLWTEYIPTPEHAEYMTWPRSCALAEVAWSPALGRSWEDFSGRLGPHLGHLDRLGVRYRPLG